MYREMFLITTVNIMDICCSNFYLNTLSKNKQDIIKIKKYFLKL